MKNKILLFLAALAVLTLVGCAWQHATIRTYDAQGNITGKATQNLLALFDASNHVSRATLQLAPSGNTNRTWAPGIYMVGQGETVASTNATGGLVNIINVAAPALGSALGAAAKTP